MTHPPSNRLVLESLAEGIPVISCGCHSIYLERCLFCLDRAGHESGVNLGIMIDDKGAVSENNYSLEWSTEINDALRRRHADDWSSTEYGAYAIAFLLVREMTPYTAIEQANRGTAVDYYLSDKTRDDDLIFNHAARLEVSGIGSGGTTEIDSRLKSKLKRLKNNAIPVYIVIVEHGTPRAKFVARP